MQKPTVLIVEDDVELANMLNEVVEMNGMSASVAGDGAEAMEQLNAESFELILLDMTLPRVSGQKVLDHVRATAHIAGTKVAVMTGNMLTIPGAEETADFMLIKPFTLVAIQDLLNQMSSTQVMR